MRALKLTGVRAVHRNRWDLFSILTLQEFVLWEYYIDQMDWDSKHREFGTFEVVFEDVGTVFGKSIDSVRVWHGGLIKKRFIALVDKRTMLFVIKNPSRYILNTKGLKSSAYTFTKEEKTQQSFEHTLTNIQFSQEEIEFSQNEMREQLLGKDNFNSKVYSSSRVDIGLVQDSEDINPFITEEDKEFIEKNVSELKNGDSNN